MTGSAKRHLGGTLLYFSQNEAGQIGFCGQSAYLLSHLGGCKLIKLVVAIGEYATPVRLYMIDGNKEAKVCKFILAHLQQIMSDIVCMS